MKVNLLINQYLGIRRLQDRLSYLQRSIHSKSPRKYAISHSSGFNKKTCGG